MAEQQSKLRNFLNKLKGTSQPIAPAEQANNERQTGTENEGVLPEANFPLGASDFKPDEYACFVPYATDTVLLHIGMTETLEKRLECALLRDPYAPHMSEIDDFHFGILYNTASGTIKLFCDCDSYEDGYETTFTADLPHFQEEEKHVLKCLDDFCKKEGYHDLSDFVKTEYPKERFISDSYIKGEKQIWGENKADEFNRKILAVNDMYGWLYQQGILRKVSSEFKDYSDITYFAFNANDLQPYRNQMLSSGLSDATLAVHHIFDEKYTPCIYSGAIELGWTMRAYRDFDGTVSRSWECDLVKHLDSPTVLEIEEIRERKGIQAAIHSVFEYSEFEPSNLSKNGTVLSVRPLEERDLASVQKFDKLSGNSVSPALNGNDDFAWGVFKGETLVGYCTIGYAEDAYEGIVIHPGYTNDSLLISEVYVSPEHRREGCGAYLVDQVIKRRTENNKQIVLLTILDDKLSNFYEKVGFTLLNDGVMLRDERSIYDKKRDEVFEKAFSYFSSIDADMADKRPYLYSHADKLIDCFENDERLDLLDVDCWSRFEDLLGKTLSHEEYQTLNTYLDENLPDGIYDPHDIKEDDFDLINELKAELKKSHSLDAKIAEASVSANQSVESNEMKIEAER